MLVRALSRTAIVGGFLLGLTGVSHAETTQSELRQTYQNVRKQVVAEYGPSEIGLKDDPQAPRLLDRAWTLIGQWAARYLDEHAHPTSLEFRAAMTALDPGLDNTQLLPLGADTYLVGVEWQDDILGGNFFVIGPKGGHREVLWNIKDAQSGDPKIEQYLAAWSAAGAVWCTQESGSIRVQHCLPLQGTAGVLPDDANGHHRFYLSAVTPGESIFMQFGQITIWSWDGKAAAPILAHNISRVPAVDDPAPRFDGKTLRMDYMDEFKGLNSTWVSRGRDAVLAIEVTPTAIRDAVLEPKIKELDLLDEFFDRLQLKQNTSGIASPEVAAKMSMLMTLPGYANSSLNVSDRKLTRENGATLLCVTFPPTHPFVNIGGKTVAPDAYTFLFKINGNDDKEFISGVTALDAQGCGESK